MIHLAGKLELDVPEAAKLLLAYPEQTLSVYDCGPSSAPSQVGPAEIGRLIVIEPLAQSVATELMKRASDAPWYLVPVDATLADADPELQLYWDAATLYAFFTAIPGVADAIASKLLHLKRPAFFPLLDSYVRELYADVARDAYRASPRAQRERPDDRLLYWAAIRQDLILDENRVSIEQLRVSLRADSAGTRLASLSAVRLIDMLAWQRVRSDRR